MVKGSKALNPTQVVDYYRQEYSRGDYYSADTLEQAPGVWRGQLAGELGLEGDVVRGDFYALVHGRTSDGQTLVAAQSTTGRRVAGWDFQVAPDKSVSVAALAYGDDRIFEAHSRAADIAFQILESRANTRLTVGSDTSLEHTAKLLAARFDHPTSRALDPQLHSHYVILNLAHRQSDGAWRALEPRDIYRAQSLATAAYHAQLAAELQGLGYAVAVSPEGYASIAGVPRDLLDHWSTRRQEILADLARRPGDLDGQAAALRTRRAKRRDVALDDLQGVWRATVAERGLTLDDLRHGLHAATLPSPVQPPEAITWASDHLAERSSRFTDSALLEAALRHATGKGAGYHEVAKGLGADRRHIRLADGTLTTPELVALERRIIQLALQPSTQPPIRAELGGLAADLNAGQRQVLADILTSRDSTLAVVGRAGVGKTHALGRLRQAMEGQPAAFGVLASSASASGWDVRAYAVTTGAVRELQTAGISGAQTVASLVAGTPAETPSSSAMNYHGLSARPQLWLVDEASLLGTRDTAGLLERARSVDARVVLIGDPRQHHGVAAGSPFNQLLDAGVPTTHLGEILRQRSNPALLAAVEAAADGRTADAAAALIRMGAVREMNEPALRTKLAAELYLQAPERSLLVAPTRAERADLNREVHDRLRERGALGEEHTVRVLEARDLTAAETRDAKSFRADDHVYFRAPSPRLGIPRHATGRVLTVDTERSRVTVRLDFGRDVTFSPRRLGALQLASVQERPLAVGDIVQFRRPYPHLGIANGARATIAQLDAAGELGLRLREPDGSERALTLQLSRDLYAMDYGYAMTSHASQGSTVDRVIPVVDTTHRAELVNQQQFYVSISRGRHEVLVVTDSEARLAEAVQRANPKPNALEPTDAFSQRLSGSPGPVQAHGLPRGAIADPADPEPNRDRALGDRATATALAGPGEQVPGPTPLLPAAVSPGADRDHRPAGGDPRSADHPRVDARRLDGAAAPDPDRRPTVLDPRPATRGDGAVAPVPPGPAAGAARGDGRPTGHGGHALGGQPSADDARGAPGDPALSRLWRAYDAWQTRHAQLARTAQGLAARRPTAAQGVRLRAAKQALAAHESRSPANALLARVRQIGLDRAIALLPSPAAVALRALLVVRRVLSMGLG